MKKKWLLALMVSLLFCSNAAIVWGDTGTVPLRATLEAQGIEVLWQREGITLSADGLQMAMAVDSDQIKVYEKTYTLAQPITVESNTTYLPASGVALIKDIILYDQAIVDAITADADEILPLVKIDPKADKVLVGTWHRHPESYVEGTDVVTKYGDIWVFTQEELMAWADTATLEGDLSRRFEQLIGLAPQTGYTSFSFLWVNPEDLYRPAYDQTIDGTMQLTMSDTASGEYQKWFEGNMAYSYQAHKYPWTRLGYTYDWADNGQEYGLSEFILPKDSTVTVDKTYSNAEFFALLENL